MYCSAHTLSFLVLLNCFCGVGSFRATTRRKSWSHKRLSTASDVDFSIQSIDGDEDSVSRVASFMLKSFWLPQVSVTEAEIDPAIVSGITYSIQQDLFNRYGALMGKRKFESSLLTAKSPGDDKILGVVGVDVTLINKSTETVFTRDQAEKELTNVLSSIGPKQRRQFKDATIHDIVAELLPNEISACVLLSNLAVCPTQRRRGVAKILCEKVESLVKDEWGFDRMYLRVEAGNAPARKLYEEKLAYELVWSEPNAPAYRVCVDKVAFDEIESETLLLAKMII